MRDTARATRAALAALSCGATPPQALAIAGDACEDPRVGQAYKAGADDLSNDSFRPDVIGRLAWSPPVVGLLLSRAPRRALGSVAEAALHAIAEPPRLPARWVVRAISGALAAIMVVVAIVLRWKLADALPSAPVTLLRLDWALAAGLAAALVVALAEVVGRVRARGLSDAQTLRWLIAGELAEVPPGAVLGPLVEQAHPLGRRLLERMRREVRGTTTMRDAIMLWAEDGGIEGSAARLVGLVADGEGSVAATRRMARVAALEHRARSDRWLLALANALVVVSVLMVGAAVYVGASEVWELLG